MNPGLYRTAMSIAFLACCTLAPLAIHAQAVTTVTIRNGLNAPLRYKSGSTGGGKESPVPARAISPGASTTYRLSQYTDKSSAGSVTYETDLGGLGCRFRYGLAKNDKQRWLFDNNAAPSGKGHSLCEMKTLKADARAGTQSLEFIVR